MLVNSNPELEEFVQSPKQDRPHEPPDPYHGNGILGRSLSTTPPDIQTISMEESWRLGIKSRSAWQKCRRKVKEDAMPGYLVKSQPLIRNGKPVFSRDFFAFSINQTEPVRRKRANKTMPISLPKNLPMAKLKKQFGKYLDRVKLFLYFITTKKLFDRRLRHDDAFATLSWKIIRKYLGRHYCQIIKKLNGWIIEVNDDYEFVDLHYCKGYRFTEEILADGYCNDVIRDEELIAKYEKRRPTTEIDRHLWSYLTQLAVDEHALDQVQADFIQKELIRDVIKGVWRYTTDKYGRRHTNLTNLSRALRKCLRYQDLMLVGLDIRNSQPLILAVTVVEILRSRKAKVNTEEKKKEVGKEGRVKETLPYATPQVDHDVEILLDNCICPWRRILPATVINSDFNDLPSDVQEYLELCQEGKIYEALMEEAGLTDRDCAKEIIFAVIYGRNHRRYDKVQAWRSTEDYEWLVQHSNSEREMVENSMPLRKLVYEAMQRRFPTVVQCMAEIKGTNEKHYKNLAHQMQRSESRIIFGACRDLMHRHPELPLWTIHDCLLTVPGQGYEELVEQALLENFAKNGIKPSIKKEEYGS
jgi:hypothetical protein